MPSLISGYNYDIFISYRQKDNKHDGWVTEFVKNLKGELEATFKEDVSVYFDENLEDRLQENHSVKKSLESKLRCLIFIPIISRTYCDPNSYAWQNELQAFIKMADGDRFGRDIKLKGGNVANRVLPIRIHDIEQADIGLFEKETCGFLRAIDFVFKTAKGVNRPLQPEDNKNDNLNKTLYRDQINKVALAVREIIYGMQNPVEATKEKPTTGKGTEKPFVGKKAQSKPAKTRIPKKPVIAATVLAAVIIILGFLFVPKIFKQEEIEKSIAVLPFLNETTDEENAAFVNGMMERILNNLQSIKDFRVISRTSTEQYRGQNKSIMDIAKELGVNYLVEGSVQKYGNTFILTVQLIEAVKKEDHLWGETYEQEIIEVKDIIKVQSKISETIAKELEANITAEEKQLFDNIPTQNITAYNYYLRGKDYISRSFMEEEDVRYAIQMYEQAVEIDPEFALAYAGLASCHRNLYSYFGRDEEEIMIAKNFLDKALELAPDLKEVRRAEAGILASLGYSNSDTFIQKMEKLSAEYPNDDEIYFSLGLGYRTNGDLRKSLEYNGKAISLNPTNWNYWFNEAFTHWTLREYGQSEADFKQAISLNPSNKDAYGRLYNLYINTGQMQKAEGFLEMNEENFEIQDFKRHQADILTLKRQYEQADSILKTLTEEAYIYQTYYYTKYMQLGLLCRLMNDNNKAVEYFEIEKDYLTERISEYQNDHRLYSSLGIVYAGLGMKEKAIEAGRKATDMRGFEYSVHHGFQTEMDMAMIMLMVGEYDEAVDRLEWIIELNGALTADNLKLDPFWDPVRNNPKFQEIINNPAYQVNL